MNKREIMEVLLALYIFTWAIEMVYISPVYLVGTAICTVLEISTNLLK